MQGDNELSPYRNILPFDGEAMIGQDAKQSNCAGDKCCEDWCFYLALPNSNISSAMSIDLLHD